VKKNAKLGNLSAKKVGALFLCLLSLITPLLGLRPKTAVAANSWEVKSIDTQIVSKCWNNVAPDNINNQVSMIKGLGSNYVAIGTPYDRPDEMKKWVDAIHSQGLNIWFRSHWLNWEGDEGQPKNLSTSDYLNKTHQFILDHPNFFKAGDSFTYAVEAENVGIGANTPFADWNAYRKFLSDEIDSANDAFSQIGLGGQVKANWLSTNGWIVDNELDQSLVDKMGMLTVDHYPPQGDPGNPTPTSQLATDMSNDLDRFYDKWKKPIMIGEWGYHIGGDVSDDLQKEATTAVFNVFASKSYLYGVNWWDHMGNQTRIINDASGNPTTLRPAASVIKSFYNDSNATTIIAPSPSQTTDSSKLIADFANDLSGFDSGNITNGTLELKNPADGSIGTRKNLSDVSLAGQKYLEFDINLNGAKILNGDASAVYFDQGGWKWVSLYSYAENGKNGWQHIKITLADTGINSNNNAAYLGFRFWNNQADTFNIDNIYLTTGTTDTSTVSQPTSPSSTTEKMIADFENGLSGFDGGTIVSGFNSQNSLNIANPVNGSSGAKKSLEGLKAFGFSTLEFDINLNGAKLLNGDASAVYFDQGGWKWVSLYSYAENGKNGWQHIKIPLADFRIDQNSGLAYLGFRFWNNPACNYSIDNITLR